MSRRFLAVFIIVSVLLSSPASALQARPQHSTRTVQTPLVTSLQQHDTSATSLPTAGVAFVPPVVKPLYPSPQKTESASVTLSGPTTGRIGTAYTFTTTVSPISATMPITYVWQATGQPPVTRTLPAPR
jgi:hypothetical protein